MDRMVPTLHATVAPPPHRGPSGYLEVTCPHGPLRLWQSASVPRDAAGQTVGRGEMGELGDIG